MGVFFGIMFFCALLITIVAISMPNLMYRKSLEASPDTIIANRGMYYMGQLHTWNRPLFKINNLEIDKEKRELIFTIRYFTKIGWYKYETYSINIPIPEGEMKNAQKIIKILK